MSRFFLYSKITPLFLFLPSLAYAGITEQDSMLMASLKMLWGLLIVLGIIFALYAIARKKLSFFPAGNDDNLIKITATRHLQPKKSLYLVEVKNKEVLIGVSNDTISLLTEITHPSPEHFAEILEDAKEQL
jgi:flagellar protein FliO/FliZ